MNGSNVVIKGEPIRVLSSPSGNGRDRRTQKTREFWDTFEELVTYLTAGSGGTFPTRGTIGPPIAQILEANTKTAQRVRIKLRRALAYTEARDDPGLATDKVASRPPIADIQEFGDGRYREPWQLTGDGEHFIGCPHCHSTIAVPCEEIWKLAEEEATTEVGRS